jgi:hypothetical protein
LGLKGTFSEGIVRDCALLGATLPYGQAAPAYAQISGIALSDSTFFRLTRREGERYAAVLEGEANAAWTGLEAAVIDLPFECVTPAPLMNLSMDGTTVNVRGEGWKEVKVAVVSEVESEVVEGEEDPEVRLKASSYRAGMWEAETFERQQWSEGMRRGLDQAGTLSSVNDGARYLWGIVGDCYPHAVEIVDWWHAVEHLWRVAQSVFGRGTEAEKEWVVQQKERLWRGSVERVIKAVNALPTDTTGRQEAVHQAQTYFRNNQHRMDYARYRAQGLPIGSGSVEGGGCKQVVGARLKQAGMRWSRDGADAVLALRSALFSDRWGHVWNSS